MYDSQNKSIRVRGGHKIKKNMKTSKYATGCHPSINYKAQLCREGA